LLVIPNARVAMRNSSLFTHLLPTPTSPLRTRYVRIIRMRLPTTAKSTILRTTHPGRRHGRRCISRWLFSNANYFDVRKQGQGTLDDWKTNNCSTPLGMYFDNLSRRQYSEQDDIWFRLVRWTHHFINNKGDQTAPLQTFLPSGVQREQYPFAIKTRY